MKLVIITAIVAFDKEVKKMLKQAKVFSYSYRDEKDTEIVQKKH